MLAGKRSVRVGDQLLRVMADLLTKRVRDPRAKRATLTGIRLSDDLRHAKVYYSVIGNEGDILKAQTGLDSAKGFIKKEMSLRMELKYMPDIEFKHDPSLEKGNSLDKLLDRLKSDEAADAPE